MAGKERMTPETWRQSVIEYIRAEARPEDKLALILAGDHISVETGLLRDKEELKSIAAKFEVRDGGGLALDPQGKLVSIWRRGEEVYVAEDGRAEKKMEAGKDAAIASGPGGVYAVWISAGALERSSIHTDVVRTGAGVNRPGMVPRYCGV